MLGICRKCGQEKTQRGRLNDRARYKCSICEFKKQIKFLNGVRKKEEKT